jgi:hypothetical protein
MIDWPNESFPLLPEDAANVSMTSVPFDDLVVKNVLATSTIMIRKSVTLKVGDFDKTLHGPEDYDYWLRCLRVTRAARLDCPLTGYRMVPGSLGKRATSMEAGMLRILEKQDETSAWQGRWLLRRRAYAYCLWSCAFMYSAAGRQFAALTRLLRSMCWYPWFLGRGLFRAPFARPRFLLVTILRLLRLKSPVVHSTAAATANPIAQAGKA